MKKIIYSLILALLVISGLVFAHRETETPGKSTLKPRSAAEVKADLKKWEATPDGIHFKKWQASPAGQKVLAIAAKIKDEVRNSTNMEAVVTSLSLPAGSRLGFGVMVKIKGEDFILSFGPEKPEGLQQLHSLKVNDKIQIRSHFVSYAPKYAYPIVSGNYIERDKKVLYQRIPDKDGC